MTAAFFIASMEDMGRLLDEFDDHQTSRTWPEGVIFLSDMAPYLIRVGCCFEGQGMPYRVDPEKLWRIIR